MIDPRTVLLVFCLYVSGLFLVALWVEKRSATGRSPANHPLVYSLSLAVYCTAWTYYGSVGKAATSGILFLPIYLGPTIVVLVWWTLLRKLVRLKTIHRITSIADFLSARYDKSQLLAALVTIIAIIGIMPYIALQLKAIISTFILITTPLAPGPGSGDAPVSWITQHIPAIVVVLMILFSIVIGVRHLDPTERHEGMITALAVECLVKLVAFLVVGGFVTYGLFGGLGDMFQKALNSSHRSLVSFWGMSGSYYATWASYLVLSMSAIICLPRQFHVTVVENPDENHILTAMWCFPLYMILINLFVLPIALGGILEGWPADRADSFVLMMPLQHGKLWMALLVFIGGVSAAAGMIMVSSVTLATMTTNHLLLPCVEWLPLFRGLKRHLLKCRWVVVAVVISVGFYLEERIFRPVMLVNIGLISFAAFLQFAPPLVGGLFWRKANKTGALLGLSAGFLTWSYTQFLPSFVRNGWLPESFVEQGPFGLELLRPETLFGLSGLDPLTVTVVWSMLFNVGFFVLGSLLFEQTASEQSTAEQFVGALSEIPPMRPAVGREAYIVLDKTIREIRDLFEQYFPEAEALALIDRCIDEAGVRGMTTITIVQLVELHSRVEKLLAGVIGSAAAYKAVRQRMILDARESRELSEIYGEILANLKLTPTELKAKIDFYQEREHLLIRQATELEEKVIQLEREIHERKRVQKALLESERRFRGLVDTMKEGLGVEDQDGFITYVNDTLCRMWGCAREEIIGKPSAQLLESLSACADRRSASPGFPSTTESYETTWTRKDGTQTTSVVSSVPLFDAEGRYEGRFSVLTDISHIKTIEREKANLISMFAHDMRSSLTGIHGLGLRLLNKGEQMDEARKSEYLRIINREAAKLEALVDDFLEFSRLETGRLKLNFRALSLDKELMELFEIYEQRASQKDLSLRIEMEEALPIIEADVNRLRRVFTNLLDNALKFSTPKGVITLSAVEATDEVVIRVRDEGIGIDPAELPYIFDIFHRAQGSERREGYGIGLATVKAIVEGHGGRVRVESEPGRGSVFSVYLPKSNKAEDMETG
ncbi:MAG: ATP-binding protein [Syntrophobacteraceae bacterium]